MVGWGHKGDTFTLESSELEAQAGKCLDVGSCFPESKILEVLDYAKEGMQGLPLNYISRDAQQKGAPRPALPRPARFGGHRPLSRTQRQTQATSAVARNNGLSPGATRTRVFPASALLSGQSRR